MSYGLTTRQRELLAYLKERETCPSFEEMQAALGLHSKSGVHRLLQALEERGYIRRQYHRARSIEVVSDRGLSDIDTSVLVSELNARGFFTTMFEQARRVA